MRTVLVFFSVVAIALSGCESEVASSKGSGAEVSFLTDVKPILKENCVRCHNEKSLFGGLDLTNRGDAMRGSTSGKVILPGNPDGSLILGALGLEHGKSEKAMPAAGPKLSEEEKDTLRRWIEQGANWPEGEEGIIAPVEVDIERV